MNLGLRQRGQETNELSSNKFCAEDLKGRNKSYKENLKGQRETGLEESYFRKNGQRKTP